MIGHTNQEPRMRHLANQTSFSLMLLLNRLAVGWFFASAGWAKVGLELDGGLGTFYRGDGFQGRNPDWLPAFVAAPYGYALPWIEVLFGLLLMVGLFSRVTAGVLTFLSVSIAVALLGAGELLPRHHVMVFITVTLALCVLGPGRYSADALLIQRRGKPDATNPANKL
jgi:putative oxidoreductase